MSAVIPQGFAQVVVSGIIHGQQTKNVWNMAKAGAPVVDNINEMIALATSVRQSFRDAGFQCISNSWSMEKVTAKLLYPVQSDEGIVFGEATDVGSAPEAKVSFESALFHVRTGKGGRTNRGRFFLPGVPATYIDDSRLTSAALTSYLLFRDELISAFGPAVGPDFYRLGVLSRKTLGNPPASYAAAFKWMTNLEVSGIVAVTRSRRIGHGG